ncbi:MAG: GyrI-like domain-containing protein [Myxococcota bacterium]
MSYTVQKRQVPAQLMACGEASATVEELPDVLGDVLPRVMRHIQAHDGQVAGPPFAHYKTMSEPMELEAGIPIVEPISDGDSVRIGELPGGSVLVTVHIGPYDQLDHAYDALMEYADTHELTPVGTVWESYWTDPASEPDPDSWKTEVFMPLRD